MPRIVDKEQKAKDIALAALRVFNQVGFHQARMADIAVAAGVGKGTLYEYFKDKLDILRFELDRYFLAFKEGIAASICNVQSPRERLLAVIDFSFAHVEEWEDHCAVFVDSFSLARTEEKQRLTLDGMYEEMRTMLVVLIREGQKAAEIRNELQPAATAELLVSLFDGIVLHGVFTERSSGIESVKAAAISILTEGMIVPSNA
jgi:TetR/AcrR family transcriptional regulator, repressor for uid operon